MAARWTPLFDDGSGVPVTSASYDTAAEAEDAGRRLQTEDLVFVQAARHVGGTAFTMLAAELRLAREERLAPAGRYSGLITRWDDTSGFATASDGTSWFVSCDDLPAGYDALPLGTTITWAGAPRCAPGKRYPQARSIQIEAS
jgi:hypothetical protein